MSGGFALGRQRRSGSYSKPNRRAGTKELEPCALFFPQCFGERADRAARPTEDIQVVMKSAAHASPRGREVVLEKRSQVCRVRTVKCLETSYVLKKYIYIYSGLSNVRPAGQNSSARGSKSVGAPSKDLQKVVSMYFASLKLGSR